MSASSNGGKSGFFGKLRGLFRRSEESFDADNGQTAVAASAPLAPPPVQVALAPASAARTAPSGARGQNGNGAASGAAGVTIPLQAVLNGLPMELRPKVRVQTVGDLTITIGLDKILSQLSQGVVTLPFGEIRQAAPQVFAPGIESDRVPVPLPLNEVLSRINPALLVRRGAQRQVEIPTEITSPFDAAGQGLSISVGNAKPVQPAAPRRTAPGNLPARGSISPVNTQHTSAASLSAAAAIPFAFPRTAPTPPATPTGPTPFPTITPITPLTPATPAAVPQRNTAMFPKPVPVPAPAPAPAAPVAPTVHGVLTVALSAVSEGWPDGIRKEMAEQGLAESSVALPADAVEAGLKKGKVNFTWKALRAWLRPAVPPSVSSNDATEVELPLKVLAPLFISRKQGAAQPQQKLTVDEEIPNLFFGFPQPETPAASPVPLPAPTPPLAPTPPTPRVPETIPMAIPVIPAAASAAGTATFSPPAPAVAAPAPALSAAAPKSADTNYYIWDDASDTTQLHVEALRRGGATSTEFVKRYASPNEIVSRAVALDGVAGALIALPDGLMVASRIPTELNADTLAAFLPQLFNKVSQCTKELRMGELNNLNFTVGNVPWKIFRVNAIFFAVFGRPAQGLPTAQLSGLAAELDRKK